MDLASEELLIVGGAAECVRGVSHERCEQIKVASDQVTNLNGGCLRVE